MDTEIGEVNKFAAKHISRLYNTYGFYSLWISFHVYF